MKYQILKNRLHWWFRRDWPVWSLKVIEGHLDVNECDVCDRCDVFCDTFWICIAFWTSCAKPCYEELQQHYAHCLSGVARNLRDGVRNWRAQPKSGLGHKNKFPRKSCQNVDLVHFSIWYFIYGGTIKCGLSPRFHRCLQLIVFFSRFSAAISWSKH